MSDQKDKPPQPPDHLSHEMKLFWASVLGRRKLQAHQILILCKALESHDRAEQARKILESEGLSFVDRFGHRKARPEVQVEIANRKQFCDQIESLHLGELETWP